ncbi:hypothetical protein [Acidianus sp. HS-5]|uniref:hypothetical protein n=1 Tax=Acidianus sp. HS-5 TaxID=2886040 RepID=UPI001F31E03C|nr:hypothetical protein [Acidianus sp. HS-5]BDC17581.1 hypothetical protein HS5_04710 [Acidianus sp. HS-5]
MQAQILIATLSFLAGVAEGLNVYKGPLFSLYLRKFNKRVEGFLLPVLSLPLFLWTAVFVEFDIPSVTVLGVVLVIMYVVKFLVWKYNHYTGSFSPNFRTAVKWMVINYSINMEFVLPIFLAVLNITSYVIFMLTNFSLKVVFSVSNEDLLRRLAMLNMEVVSILVGLTLGLFLVASQFI